MEMEKDSEMNENECFCSCHNSAVIKITCHVERATAFTDYNEFFSNTIFLAFHGG